MVGLFADRHSPLLTTFYGRTASFASLTEQALGGNMEYGQFINSKWNWQKVMDLSEENKIFSKVFRENITLAPLEIRTFLFRDLKLDGGCIAPSELKYNKKQIKYQLDTEKPHPVRDPLTLAIEKELVDYVKNGDHCKGDSPVLEKTSKCALI